MTHEVVIGELSLFPVVGVIERQRQQLSIVNSLFFLWSDLQEPPREMKLHSEIRSKKLKKFPVKRNHLKENIKQ